MSSSKFNNALIIENFSFLQVVFWFGLCLITFLSLTVWYNQIGFPHASHTFLQAGFGYLLSIFLHLIYKKIWHSTIMVRAVISFISVLIISAAWNFIRMYFFVLLTKEHHIWQDFGGWYFGAIFVFLCWTALYHGILYYQLLLSENQKKHQALNSASNEKIKRFHAESEKKEAQLKMLRYQLNPHFLFNTLNAINSLIGSDDGQKAQKMIVQLSHFLRYSLDNNPEMKISMEREVAALMLYLEIEKTRFGERLNINFDIDEITKTALIPSLLLQPLIENSMKYAISKNEDGGQINLLTKKLNNHLVIELSDSGNGKGGKENKAHNTSGRGIGLRNTIDRLKTFYDDDFEFNLQSMENSGLQATIQIPFETEEH